MENNFETNIQKIGGVNQELAIQLMTKYQAAAKEPGNDSARYYQLKMIELQAFDLAEMVEQKGTLDANDIERACVYASRLVDLERENDKITRIHGLG